jgi:hypothetical protein
VLGGRYRLEERVRTSTEGSVWRALDETLERPVVVRALRPSHPYAPDVLDAARMAALVDDARLVRVLDVGEESGVTYVVTELVHGRTLGALVDTGPLPAETVRRLVGEAAQALDSAGSRGLRHLCLTPLSLIVTDQGAVKVHGTAVEAAMAGIDPGGTAVAARIDAVALVSLVYAGLTGLWPGAPVPELQSAPRVAGRSVAPGDLVSGVPNDLDTLCSVTLGPHEDGPRTPGELARQLTPWAPPQPLEAPAALTITGPIRPVPAEIAPASLRHALGPDDTGSGLPTLLPVDSRAPATAPSTMPAQPASGHGRQRHAAPAPGALERDRHVEEAGRRPGLGTEIMQRVATVRAASAHEQLADPVPWLDQWAGGPPAAGNGRGAPPREDPFLSLGPVDEAQPPPTQSRLVIVVLLGVVVVGLVLAAMSLRDFRNPGLGLLKDTGGLSTPSASVSPSASAAGSAPTGGTAGGAPSGTSPGSAAPAATVSAVRILDDKGDEDTRNGKSAGNAIDGNPATAFVTQTYSRANFGGLKPGIGIALDLGAVSTVRRVELDVAGSGGAFELRPASGPSIDGTSSIASGRAAGGKVTLQPSAPVKSRWLVVWVTQLPDVGGSWRLELAEIRLQ